MSGTPAAAVSPENARPPRLPVAFRRARVWDVGRLARAYLALSEQSRRGYHPFRFNAFTVRLTYFALTANQTLLAGFMRRHPKYLALVFVAEVEGTKTLAGSGTLRGVLEPGEEPRVRMGFFVSDSFQGQGVGKTILGSLAAAALQLGFRQALGAVFQSDSTAIRAISASGFRFSPTEYRDPKSPGERNYRTIADLAEMVQIHERRTQGSRSANGSTGGGAPRESSSGAPGE